MENKEQLPNATLILIFGIASIVTCICYGVIGLIFGIIALVISKKSTEIYASNPDLYYGYENLKAGRICAIIGIVLSSLYVLLLLGYLIFIGVMLPWEELLNQ